MANEEGKPTRQGPASQTKSTQQLAQENVKKWSELVARAWADERLKQRLLKEPAAVLREHGIEVPAGMELRVVENTDKIFYLRLPAKPVEDRAELTPSQLENIAGGLSRRNIWDPPVY
jgi:hypothetical protein